MAAPRIRIVESYSTHQKYLVDFFGEGFIVTVTSTCFVIRKWISNVIYVHNSLFSRPLVVGVGVQWTPFKHYYTDTPHDHPADTLQLCVGKSCLIIKLSHCDQVPNLLRRFLTDPNTAFVGVWNHQDAEKLARCVHQLEIGELLDIRHYVNGDEGRSMIQCSFEEIVEECLGYEGVRLDPQISLSDWSDFNLNPAQILQASLDVYLCHKLGVLARLFEN